MSEPAVRPATLADVTEIAMIHVRSWQAAYRGLMPQDYLRSLDPAARGALAAEPGRRMPGHHAVGPAGQRSCAAVLLPGRLGRGRRRQNR